MLETAAEMPHRLRCSIMACRVRRICVVERTNYDRTDHRRPVECWRRLRRSRMRGQDEELQGVDARRLLRQKCLICIKRLSLNLACLNCFISVAPVFVVCRSMQGCMCV